jgi:hypothetical protein
MATLQSVTSQRMEELPPPPTSDEIAISVNLKEYFNALMNRSMGTMVDEEKKEELNLPVPAVLPAFRPSMSPASDQLVGRVIGSTDLCEFASCPCCQQKLGETSRTLNEPMLPYHTPSPKSLLDDDAAMQEDDDLLPGVLAAGQEYTPRRVLVEGWLHKKGTGHDWLCSRAWKARWARLALAKVQGYDSEVPLLLIYWFPSSMSATTAIVLDSTVVLGVDLADKSLWNSSRFEIRHASTRENVTIPVTRTFAASQQSRDAWVYAISEALLNYEKEKARARKVAVCKPVRSIIGTSSPDRSVSPRFDEGWAGGHFAREASRPPTPPSSGRPSQAGPPLSKRSLKARSAPRATQQSPNLLAGESMA